MNRVLLLLGLVVLSLVSSYSVTISDCSSNLSVSGETYFLDSPVVGQNCNITSSNVVFDCQDNSLSDMDIYISVSDSVSVNNCNFINLSITSLGSILDNFTLENISVDNLDQTKNFISFSLNNSLVKNIFGNNFNFLIDGDIDNSIFVDLNLSNFFQIVNFNTMFNSSFFNIYGNNMDGGFTYAFGMVRILFDNINFINGTEQGIFIRGVNSEHVLIQNSYFFNFSDGLLIFPGVDNITIRNSLFENNSFGIRFDVTSSSDPVINAYVYNNTIRYGYDGLNLVGNIDDSYFYDNIIYDNSYDFVYLGTFSSDNSYFYNNYFGNLSLLGLTSPENFNSNFTYLGQGNTYGNDTAFSGTVCHATGVCDTNATVLTYADFNTLIESLLPTSSTVEEVDTTTGTKAVLQVVL